ncbi:MAG: hemolysin III family protein [Caldilineaceae bacterium]|nr:hemolysin III family protein [Caldilineaceae bacterium]
MNKQDGVAHLGASAKYEQYTWQEEIAHATTHGLGILLSVLGGVWLCVMAGNLRQTIGFTIYGLSSTLLYLASTLYHGLPHPNLKGLLRRLDHSAIYLLIAGSSTPFLLTLRQGWLPLLFMWGLAVAGIAFKLLVRNPHRYERISLAGYLAMGWVGALAAWQAIVMLSTSALVLLVCGGLLYTFGVFFYNWVSLRYHHAIWHLFVLSGSICHYFAIMSLAR